ncbi:hypothetical protein AAHN97_20420 [Chitinophaga niabensis]|uniref:hypothetical protein n=1 Tax=Chitinophaga niabensis TaxID=536979 RepID=UPI0031BABCF9
MHNDILTFHWDGYDHPFEVEMTKVDGKYRFDVSFVRATGNLHEVINLPVYFIFETQNQTWESSGWIEERGEDIMKNIWNAISDKYVSIKNGSILDDK